MDRQVSDIGVHAYTKINTMLLFRVHCLLFILLGEATVWEKSNTILFTSIGA